MGKNSRTSNAVEILHKRYVGEDAERKASLQEERVNADVAQMIYDLRQESKVTQKDLAKLIGTTQSVISRLEDSDYDGHSLSMLSRIAKALNKRLTVKMMSAEKEDEQRQTMRYVFSEVIKGLRRQKGLKVGQFAKKVGIDKRDVIAMERNVNYLPSPLILDKLSRFFAVSQRKLATLVGAFKDVSPEFRKEASSFAAKSESFAKLTEEEKQTLDEFVRFLKDEGKNNA